MTDSGLCFECSFMGDIGVFVDNDYSCPKCGSTKWDQCDYDYDDLFENLKIDKEEFDEEVIESV